MVSSSRRRGLVSLNITLKTVIGKAGSSNDHATALFGPTGLTVAAKKFCGISATYRIVEPR
jgi:hypothetical protein